jgi:hypothetical protein
VTENGHSAAASALGYLYQFDWALLQALDAYPRHAQRRISVELVDDIGIHDGPDGSMILALEQLKHHVPASDRVTDYSSDVWRTIKSWLDADPAPDDDGPQLVLITTQTAHPESAAALLKPDDVSVLERQRRVEDARGRLELAATNSKDKGTKAAREAFLALSPLQRSTLLSRMVILDESTPITGLDARLLDSLGHVVPAQSALFLERLRGWWGLVLRRLLTGEQLTIRVLDVHTQVSQLRDDFGAQHLPTTVTEDDVRELIEGSYDRQFVRQLEWISHTPKYIELAVLDYHRAYAQRARWATEDLIGLDDLDLFEQRLREDWRRRFEETLAELATDATAEDRETAGRQLLATVMNDASILIREHYRERFFAAGTRHALADLEDVDRAIGWHPDFRSQLAGLLGRAV